MFSVDTSSTGPAEPLAGRVLLGELPASSEPQLCRRKREKGSVAQEGVVLGEERPQGCLQELGASDAPGPASQKHSSRSQAPDSAL